MFQPGQFKYAIGYKNFDRLDPGFEYYWDDVSKAPYAYNSHKGYFLSYDNPKSIAFKTRYALEKKLKGIMFWELANDLPQEGLLEALVKTANSE